MPGYQQGKEMASLKGELFVYGNFSFCAFESGRIGSSKCLVLIGGLKDGLLTGLFNPVYSKVLSCALLEENFSAVQYISTCSYHGYGTSNLLVDSSDLIELLNDLVRLKGKKEIVLLGHSTGCQIIMTLLGNFKFKQEHRDTFGCLKGAILHGPVSDREYLFHSNPEQSSRLLDFVNSLDDYKLDMSIYPERIDDVAMSTGRIKSIYEKNGLDDFFSTDQTVAERKVKASNLGIPLFAIFNGNDEYFPFDEDRLKFLIESMKEAWPEIEQAVIIDDADHGCREGDSFAKFLDIVMNKLKAWTR